VATSTMVSPGLAMNVSRRSATLAVTRRPDIAWLAGHLGELEQVLSARG
jgi:hypothetical protein